MREIWRSILGAEGYYSISNLGNVRRDKESSCSKSGRVLKNHLGNRNYYVVNLYTGSGKHKFAYVHRLVVEAFLGTIDSDKEVNHIDGNKLNNSISNLEIVTPKENIRHAFKLGLRVPIRGERQHSAKLTYAKAEQIRYLRSTHGTFLKDLAFTYGVSTTTVHSIIKGTLWSCQT